MNNIFFYQTDIGEVGIAENGGNITNIFFANEQIPRKNIVFETDILKETAGQLQGYLAGELKEFDLPLALDGTEFMQRVWKSLLNIPYGETRSYQQIARSVGNIKASRAVGHACSRNPIPIIIPCHRVIGANGRLTGFGGGLDIKSHLLELEKKK
ncbi:MAG: methylated-DNA--[protein]-cysteine S-methyltransferase [Desulfotomaculaceae bacterium]|nr:methylated-DNA--[protein]-cysteine S-methyltransferase [Desulfotomaculaceae bacterium]